VTVAMQIFPMPVTTAVSLPVAAIGLPTILPCPDHLLAARVPCQVGSSSHRHCDSVQRIEWEFPNGLPVNAFSCPEKQQSDSTGASLLQRDSLCQPWGLEVASAGLPSSAARSCPAGSLR
jgi:hypothetical protein